jgi:hypothetical protein
VKLIKDVIRECGTPAATLKDGKVNWGAGDWEPILQVSRQTILGVGGRACV